MDIESELISETLNRPNTATSNKTYTRRNSTVLSQNSFVYLIPSFLSQYLRDYIEEMLIKTNYEKDKKEGKSYDLDAFPAIWKPFILKPMAVESFAAIMIADVSGYSTLCSILAERGNAGTELLSRTMKGYFDKVFNLFNLDCSSNH
jgi:hypothetical protein